MKPHFTNLLFVLFTLCCSVNAHARQPSHENGDQISASVDWPNFLAQHDMVWDRVPPRWELAPFTGNGNVGFLFYQAKGDAKNVISIFAGRHDYSDHRLPHEGNENLWIYRSRLPLGHFKLKSKGDIRSADLRLSLWNAELTGTIQTERGSYKVRGLSHSVDDVIYFETDAFEGESVQVTWHPAVPFPPVRETLDAGGGPKGAYWDKMRTAPVPMPPAPTLSKADGIEFCLQMLHDNRGETTTGWEISGDSAGKQVLTASVHHSFPEHDSLETVKQNLIRARKQIADQTFVAAHQQWWHDYYPLSFLSINDPEKEAFYWIQMYKFASATRGDGPIMDLMGPWYHKTFWPMVWGDLNVELQYWTHLTANRLGVGESLPNSIDRYADNLAGNVPKSWKDSAAVAALFPQDMIANNQAKVPDMLAWILHDYWLHCSYAGDRDRMREKLFPILRKTVNSYLNYLRQNAVDDGDGKIHIKYSWSPEYPGGRGRDINFTIALMQWSCQTLLDINREHGLNDPFAAKWQNIVDNLVEFQIDENGMRIGKDIPFELPHRHYSHLLAFYPLAVLTPDDPEKKKLLRTSLDHWLDVSVKGKVKVKAMPVTGYTATGAASMYAMLGDAGKAYEYLDFLIQHKNVSSTTMYAEGSPVIESPLSFATCIHDMLLQSWGGRIRVLPASPKRWPDVVFHRLRTQGAFLVSAKRKAGVTQFVSVESLVGSPCVIQTDIPSPKIYIDGRVVTSGKVREIDEGLYEIKLSKGETAILTPVDLKSTDLQIEPIPVSESNRNLFGLSKKTERLPGHKFYGGEKVLRKERTSKRGIENPFGDKPSYPKFSWDTTPMYFMFGDTQRVLSAAEVSSIAARTDFICIEKSHATRALGAAELGAKHEAAAFKKINPDVKVLFYFNSAYAWPFTSYNTAFTRRKIDSHPDLKKLLLVDPETGELARRQNIYCFDVLNPEFRQWWVDTVAKGVAESGCDGAFIDQMHGFVWLRKDRSQEVRKAMGLMMAALKAKLGDDKILLGNNATQPVAKHVFSAVDASLFEHYNEQSLSKERLLQDWDDMLRLAKAGKISVFRIGVESEGSSVGQTDQLKAKSEPTEKMAALAKDRLEYYLACYLIGAQPYSYFQYGWGWKLSSGSLRDYPELHKPLGPPQGPYQRTDPRGWEFTREFEHASVWVDTKSKQAKIKWKTK